VSDELKGKVEAALSALRNDRVGTDVLSAGMIQDLAVGADGVVSFTFLLSNDDSGMLVRQARRAVENVDGVVDVKIQVTNPGGAARASHPPPGPPPGPPPPPPQLGTVIAISSGKGGVGKSTVAANLAIALTQAGHRVGLMDADVYGPNLPRMFGRYERPMVNAERRIVPLEAHGVRLMSLGFLVERDAPAIWRGPIIMKVIQQFLQDVDWGELDYFIVDLPPGTGDAQLSLVQATQVAGAVIVTTPQEMAVGDALRGAKMFERVGVPVLGVVENMAGYTDATGQRIEFFGSGGGQRLAEELAVPLLGSIPLQPGLAEHADLGAPVLIADPGSRASQELASIAGAVVAEAARRPSELPVIS
jgi:ATP-binding protein involved in chromosome partitioning